MRDAPWRVIALFTCSTATGSCLPPNPSSGSAWEWIPTANVKPADTTCQQVLANGRTINLTFFLHLRLRAQSSSEPLQVFQLTALQEILPFLKIPDTLSADFAWSRDTSAWRRKKGTPEPRSSPPASGIRATLGELDVMIAFDLNRDGRTEGLRVTLPSQLRSLHDSLIAAVRNAESARAFPPIPDNLQAPQHFTVRLVVRAKPEADLAPIDTMQIRFPTYTKDAVLSRMQPPGYPRAAKEKGIEHRVLTSFVIAADGSVRPGSVRILIGKYTEFIRVVARSLEAALFLPAEYRGCPLAAHVHQPFEFAIGR